MTACIAISGAVASLAGFQVFQVLQAARELQGDALAVQVAVGGMDADQVNAATAQLQASAEELQARTSAPTWRVLQALPGIGDAATAISTLAGTTGAIAAAADPLLDAVMDQESSLGKATALLQSRTELQHLADVTAKAQQEMAPYEDLQLPLGLGDQIMSASQAISGLATATAALSDAAGPIATMAGMDGPRTWLVMSQNPAEARGSGGLFNAYLIVRVDEGRIEILEAGSRKQLDGEFPRDEQIPYLDIIDPDTASSWGPVLGEWASFNLPRDFPTVASLAAAGMAQRGTPVDGVLAIDPTVVQAILAGTGPVEHQGVTIDGTNAAAFFTKGLYEDFPGFDDVAAKDELAMGLVYATIDAAIKRPLDLASLWAQVSEAITGGHLKAWTQQPATQAWIQSTPISGGLKAKADEVVVSLNNGTGGKLDAYLSTEVMTDAASCASRKEVVTKVRMANDAPAGLPAYVDVTLDQYGQPDPSVPKGQTLTYVTFYPPSGWQLQRATLDAAPAKPWSVQEAGRQAWLVPVTLQRSQQAEIAITWNADTCPAGVPTT